MQCEKEYIDQVRENICKLSKSGSQMYYDNEDYALYHTKKIYEKAMSKIDDRHFLVASVGEVTPEYCKLWEKCWTQRCGCSLTWQMCSYELPLVGDLEEFKRNMTLAAEIMKAIADADTLLRQEIAELFLQSANNTTKAFQAINSDVAEVGKAVSNFAEWMKELKERLDRERKMELYEEELKKTAHAPRYERAFDMCVQCPGRCVYNNPLTDVPGDDICGDSHWRPRDSRRWIIY